MAKHPLTFLLQDADVSGSVSITAGSRPGEWAFTLANANGQAVAVSTSGRALAKYAFENGADLVAHNYDLLLDPEVNS